MKTHFKIGWSLTTLLLVASCINESVDNLQTNQSEENSAELYALFSIGLPTINSRGVDGYEDTDEDTRKNEYAIDNAYIYYFQLSSNVASSTTPENGATFVTSQKLDLANWTEDHENTDLTGRKSLIVKLPFTPYQGDKYYALLVLNQNNTFSIPKDKTTFDKWNESSKNFIEATGKINNMKYTSNGTEYFTMMNAPRYKNLKTVILEELDLSKLSTSLNNDSDPAATFYVQRGVAKVKIGASKDKDLSSIEVLNSKAKIKISNWALNLTNTISFPVQNIKGLDNYWKKEHFTSKTLTNFGYHLWWGIDPNYYGTESNSFGFNTISEVNNGINDIEYCLENTMNYDQMKKNQITQVVFKCSYLLDGQNSNSFVVYDPTGLAFDISKYIKENPTSTVDDQTSNKISHNLYKINDLIQDKHIATVVSDLKAVDGNSLVSYYPDGTTYYVAYIRHFNDEEAGLGGQEIKPVSYTEEHLGRYGILRNNVYMVNVRSVKGFGLPTIPVPSNDIVDAVEEEKYLMFVDVNILAWAHRSYDYDLQ